MRILVLDEEIPFPPNSGKRLRTFNLFKHLAKKHEIFWVSRHLEDIDSNPKEFQTLGIRTHVIEEPVRKKSGPRFYLSLLTNLFSPYPYVVSSHLSKRFSNTIDQMCKKEFFDLIHCEWTPYAVNLPQWPTRPTVCMAHNVESKVWHGYKAVEHNLTKKLYISLQAKKMERFERETLPKFTSVIAVSEYDRNLIAKWVSPDHIAVVPNGVDVDYFDGKTEEEISGSLVFVGSLDWRPNIDCVIYFLNEIWPLIKSSCPGARFLVVGRNPNGLLQSRIKKEQSVTLHGSLDDVRPFLGRAEVCIVPLRIGSGSRLKILEAFAMRKPVVSTSTGAEGLEVENAKHLLIADSPAEFAAAVTTLMKDRAYRRKLASEGRQLVEKKYAWQMLATQLENEWQKAVCQYTLCR